MSEKNGIAGAPFYTSRKFRVIAIVVAVTFLAYTAFGFFLVPRLVRSQIEDFTTQHYHRKPTMGDIRFNPFTLALEVRGFSFADSHGAPLLAFERLLVNVDVSSLWRRGLSLHAVELDKPSGRMLVRPDGSLNLNELSAPFAAAAKPASGPSEPTRFFLDRFKLTQGVFEFEDQSRQVPFKARLTPVNFELLDFSTTGKTGNNYQLQAMSTAGEKFRWSGSVALAPLSSRGQFELAEVQARTLWSYLQESLGFEVASGVVGLNGSYQFAATEPQLTLDLTLSTLAITQLGIRARGNDTDWVHLDGITVGDTRVDLARRQLSLGNVRFDSGKIIASRSAKGVVNLLTLLDAPANVATAEQPPAPAADTRSSPAWSVSAPDIVIDKLRIELEDAFVRPTARYVLSPVNLHLRNVSNAPGQHLDLDSDLTLESGGRIRISGQGVPADQSMQARLDLEDLNLAALQPYVGTYTQMTLLSGVLSAGLDADFKAGSYRLSGDLSCATLHTVDDALREDFIKWERLALTGIDYRSQPQTLRIAAISAKQPYVRLIIAPDQTTNVGKVLARPVSAPGPVQTVSGVTTSRSVASPTISIGKVQVENGSANFADFWIKPNYAVSLQQLGGSISGLSSQKNSRAKVALTGKIDRYAPVEIAGELNLLSASLFTDLRVKFDGVELTSVTPYSGRFAGYRIEKGKLSVDVRYRVENRQLNAEQRFVVDQLTLGDRVDSPDAVKLPLRLAVALLKDRNGVIDLGLPITGSLDDPKFRLGPIIWKAFINLLGGIATSPFKLIGNMFGGGEEVNLIDFDAGSDALDAGATEKLGSLRKALHERPQLALEVPAVYAVDADYDFLASRRLEEQLAALAATHPSKPDPDMPEAARRFEWLLELHRSGKATVALPPAAQALQQIRAKDREVAALEAANRVLETVLRPDIDALQPELEALAQRRARNIQDALLSSGEVEAARVFMLATSAAPATQGKVRVALSLK